MADNIKVERESLAQLQHTIYKLEFAANDAIRLVHLAIQRTMDLLQERINFWQREVARRRDAYVQCRSYRDENDYPPPCSAELAALEEAQRELDNIYHWQTIARQAVDAYQPSETQLNNAVTNAGPQARNYLKERGRHLETYLSSSASGGTVSASSGVGSPRIGSQMPPDMKEGNIGGPERGG